MTKTNSSFTEALTTFANAAVELLSSWEQADHTGAYFIDKYPFEKSFDEVVHDILEWRDTCKGECGDVGNDPLFRHDIGDIGNYCEICAQETNPVYCATLHLLACAGGAMGDINLCTPHYDQHVAGTAGDDAEPCDICQPRPQG